MRRVRYVRFPPSQIVHYVGQDEETGEWYLTLCARIACDSSVVKERPSGGPDCRHCLRRIA